MSRAKTQLDSSVLSVKKKNGVARRAIPSFLFHRKPEHVEQYETRALSSRVDRCAPRPTGRRASIAMRLPWIVLVCALRFSSDRAAGEETAGELHVPANSTAIEHGDDKTTRDITQRGLFVDETEANGGTLAGERNESVVADRRPALDVRADANETEVEESSSDRDETLVGSPSLRGLFGELRKNSTPDRVDESAALIGNSTAKGESAPGEGNGKSETGNAAEAAERRSPWTLGTPPSETGYNSNNIDGDKNGKNSETDVTAEIAAREKIGENSTGDSSSLAERRTSERVDVGRNEIRKDDNEPGAASRIMGADEDERGNEAEAEAETLIDKLKKLSYERRRYLARKLGRLLRAESTNENENDNERDDEESACSCHRCCRCGCGKNKKADEKKRLSKIVRPIKIDDVNFDFPRAKNIRRTIQESDETSAIVPRRETARPDWSAARLAQPISAASTTTEAPTTTARSAETAAALATSEIPVSARKKNRRKRPFARRRDMSVRRVAKKCDRLRASVRKESSLGEEDDDAAIDEQLARPYFRANFDDLEEPAAETADNDEFGGAVTETPSEPSSASQNFD